MVKLRLSGMDDLTSRAIDTLLHYAATEQDLAKVKNLLIELNVILDVLDSRLNPN
jgi:hypothetical protein